MTDRDGWLWDKDWNPVPPYSEPTTSRDAALSMIPSAETLRMAVLAYIDEQGPAGATDEEIQLALSMEGNTERPRRRELVQAGVVADSGARRKTSTGRAAKVWVRGCQCARQNCPDCVKPRGER